MPRSFLVEGVNTLTLFEELGGNPTLISFKTVAAGTICAMVEEGKTLELSCSHGRTISAIQVATYGDVEGRCEAFGHGTCGSESSLTAVEKACIGQKACSIEVSDSVLGESSCGNDVIKRLAVQAIC